MLTNILSWPLSLLKAFLGLQATFHLMGKPDRGGLLRMTKGSALERVECSPLSTGFGRLP